MHLGYGCHSNVQVKKKKKNKLPQGWAHGKGQGWGNQGNQGWGNEGNQGNQGNQGWGNQGNQGWGNEGNQENQGWGNQGNQGNQGWGNQGNQQNQGWGNQGNQGWGGQEQNLGYGGMGFIQGGSEWGNNYQGSGWVQQQRKRNENNIFNPGHGEQIDINDVLQEQIIFLEPSPAKQKLEQLRKEGKKFVDDRFPPNQSSLSGQWGHLDEWKNIKWKKIEQSLPDSKIFQGKIQPGDIKQGYLGDCYFLAGLAALAERPDRIFNLFLLQQKNQQNYYSVKLLFKGKWMTIDLDEYVPFIYGKPAFTKANQNQLWVILLEKAWAKLYCSYKRIQAGYPEEGLHDLTGAPITRIYLKHYSFNKQRQWKYLLKASQMEYSMCASSQPGSDTTKSQTGVVQGHAYTFLNAALLKVQGNHQRIVQLRNPWGKGEGKGKWSDTDPNWQYVDQDEKDRVGFHPDKDDGIFFMTYDDFCEQFRAMTIAQINDSASYVYCSHKDPENKGVYFKIEIQQSGNYSLHVDKTPQRSFQDKLQNAYRYPESTLKLIKYKEGNIEQLQGQSSSRRTMYKGYDLQPGCYIATVKINYDPQFQKAFDVNLAVYAEFACQVKLASNQEAVAASGNPNVEWEGIPSENQGGWNSMGNWAFDMGDHNQGWDNQEGGNSGWGQQGQGGNQGWGQQGQGENQGWGQQGQGGNQGWGQQGQGGNQGWGGQNQDW